MKNKKPTFQFKKRSKYNNIYASKKATQYANYWVQFTEAFNKVFQPITGVFTMCPNISREVRAVYRLYYQS